MDVAEKEALKKEIMSELETKLKGVVIREDTRNILREARSVLVNILVLLQKPILSKQRGQDGRR